MRSEGESLIPKHGGYRKLRSYQCAQLVYDLTVYFCDRFIDKKSRTHDQMVQAARSGVRNIAEGSMASATSKKGELKLTGVARASLEELALDYEDFLRHNGFEVWAKGSQEAKKVREALRTKSCDELLKRLRTDRMTGDKLANTLVCLVNQATFLLRRQLDALGRAFQEEGGFTERLYSKRSEHRTK